VILEREEERRTTAGLIAAATAGEGSTVLVEGPAGVGKTTILGMLAEGAQAAGMRVLAARAVPVEQSEAWAGVRRLFDRTLQQAGEAQRKDLLGGAAANAKAPLGLELEGPAVLDPFTCIHGLYWLVANLTNDGPVLVVLDDVQWLDAPSARWLAHMASRSHDLPLIIAVGWRTGERGSLALAELDALDVERLRLEPLSRAGSRSLVSERLPDARAEALADACHEATGGNPFLLDELCKSIAEHGSEGLDEDRLAGFGSERVGRSLRRRLERLGPEAVVVAEVLSVLGERASLADTAAMAGLDTGDAAEAVEALADADVLVSGGGLEFRHPVLQAALYDSIDRPERSRRHRAVARALHGSIDEPERIASHLLRTHPAGDEWVVERLAEAAGAASERGASEVAAEYLERALAEPPAPEDGVRLRFRHALASLGQGGERPVVAVIRALNAVPEGERGAAALEAARALGLLAEHGAALEACDLAGDLAQLPAEIASRISDEMIVHMLTVGPSMWPGTDPETALARAPEPPDPGASALREVSTALVAVKAGRPVEIQRLVDAVPGLIDEFPSTAFVAAAFGLLWCDELATARTLTEAGLAYSRSVGSPTGVAQWSAAAAAASLREGKVQEALVSASTSVEFNLDRPPPTVAYPLAPMIDSLVLRGELDEANEAAKLATDRTDGFLSTATLTEALGRLALARGEVQRAVRLLEDAGRRFDSMGFTAPALSAWRSWLAEALVMAGERERARELAEAQLQIACGAEARRAIGEAQRALALTLDPEERGQGLERAVETLRGSPARIELARALVDLGGVLGRVGKRKEARVPLEEAMRIAQVCGAGGIEERARSALVATGARPRRRALSGIEALTPSELRVADVIAAGMTNREAAEALFLSEKTVEGHLGRIFRKLGISSRTELAARLRRPPET
jgi:DNA-binding CsgD family transcriptional regulator